MYIDLLPGEHKAYLLAAVITGFKPSSNDQQLLNHSAQGQPAG